MKIVLPGERPVSWNQAYAGQHWSKRKAEADRVHRLVLNCPRDWEIQDPPYYRTKPVSITLTAYFKNRPLDADNICSKLYIDALKGWLIKDDSPEYVHSVTTASCVDKANPRVEIDVIGLELNVTALPETTRFVFSNPRRRRTT